LTPYAKESSAIRKYAALASSVVASLEVNTHSSARFKNSSARLACSIRRRSTPVPNREQVAASIDDGRDLPAYKKIKLRRIAL
jgi:hypothetical protein